MLFRVFGGLAVVICKSVKASFVKVLGVSFLMWFSWGFLLAWALLFLFWIDVANC